jgi:hypothetical protein
VRTVRGTRRCVYGDSQSPDMCTRCPRLPGPGLGRQCVTGNLLVNDLLLLPVGSVAVRKQVWYIPCESSVAALPLHGPPGLVCPGPPHSDLCVGLMRPSRSYLRTGCVWSVTTLSRIPIPPSVSSILESRTLLLRPPARDVFDLRVLPSLFRPYGVGIVEWYVSRVEPGSVWSVLHSGLRFSALSQILGGWVFHSFFTGCRFRRAPSLPMTSGRFSCDFRNGRCPTFVSCPVSSVSHGVGVVESCYVTRVVPGSTMEGGPVARGSEARMRRTFFRRTGAILEIRILRCTDEGKMPGIR